MRRHMRKELTAFMCLALVLGYQSTILDSFYTKDMPVYSYPLNNLQTTYEDNANLDTREKNWFFEPKNDGTPAGAPGDVKELLQKYSGYYLGDTSKKVLYLTFDEGYENGYTSKMLDLLKSNNVPAAFFVTDAYIQTNPDLVKRMVDEGHLVCNHTANHPSMASITDKSRFDSELKTVENSYKQLIGKEMPKFFRPPMGKYSELSLFYTKQLGYKTIFWSFAYADWDKNKQPSADYGKKIIMKRTHNGAIVLLHAVSRTNAEILDTVIKEWKGQGYELKALTELP